MDYKGAKGEARRPVWHFIALVNINIPAQQILSCKDNHGGQLHRIPCMLQTQLIAPHPLNHPLDTPGHRFTCMDPYSTIRTESYKSHACMLPYMAPAEIFSFPCKHTFPFIHFLTHYEIFSCTHTHTATRISTQLHRHIISHFPKRSMSEQGR